MAKAKRSWRDVRTIERVRLNYEGPLLSEVYFLTSINSSNFSK